MAVTETLCFTVTAHVLVPPHAPDQPVKLEPKFGFAVSLSDVPDSISVVHVVPQLMPDGELVTIPEPAPKSFTETSYNGRTVNFAVTDWADFKSTVQLSMPEHALPQPAKLEPLDGVAVNVTVLSALNAWLQFVPQLMPAGVLVTVPLPESCTVSIKEVGEEGWDDDDPDEDELGARP